MSTIKNRLKILRTNEGITQDELAQIINKELKENEKPISKMVISNWENNKHTIKPDKAQQLADYFGVSVGYLLGYEMNLKKAHEKLKEFNSTLPTVKEFDELLYKQQESRFKRFVQFISDEEMKIKDRNLVLIFNLLVSSDESFVVNQIYPFPLDEKDEYHFTNQEKSEK
jgi:XRE family transcriptional regulator